MFKNKIRRHNKSAEKSYILKEAFKVSISYAIFGSLWILFSDIILDILLPNIEMYKRFQTYKGWFYVLTTTILVYMSIKRRMKLWIKEYENKEKAYSELKLAHEELIKLEANLNYQKRFNESILMEAPSLIITWNDLGQILTINPFGQNITGYTEEELVNSSGWPLLVPDDRLHMVQYIYNRIKNKETSLNFEGAIITKEGKRVDILWSSKILLSQSDDGGNIYVSIGTDIEERKKYEMKIKNMAYHDFLTGLPNRFMFEQVIDRRILENKSAFMIAYMDIDNFKNINDSIGHQAGDVFLQYFTDAIKEVVRESAVVARLGGDEFAILYPLDSRLEVKEKVEDLLNHINRIWSYQNRLFYISVSVGIVAYPDHGLDSSELLKNADIAMYASKREGKNRILFYEEELKEENSHYGDMVNYLQQSIDQEQFYLVYQPQFNLTSNKLTGMEVLLRWEHPQEGFISPSEFIPIAEKSGQIYRLERWVIRKALEQKMIWEKRGIRDLKMAINLSTKTLTSDINFSEWEQILSWYSVDFSDIVIEITETANIYDIDNVINRLNRLKKRGIKIALDDFGTGYSSLNYLKKLPIDIIKLDKSFIRFIKEGGVDSLLIKNILNLANDLNYEVIAEGIETQEQLMCLIDFNCGGGQGYLLSEPLSEDKLYSFIYEKLLSR